MSTEQLPEVDLIAEQDNIGLSDRLRNAAVDLRVTLGRAGAAGLLLLGSTVATYSAEEIANPGVAYADSITYSDLGYPNATMPCEHSPYNVSGYCADYDWGPVHTQAYNDPSEYSSRGYSYRNCTDYVAWRVNQASGGTVSVPSNLRNGGQWYANAPASERSSTPKAGDAAVVPGNPGHVAFVEAVNSDGTITVSEYNHDAKGDGDTWTGAPSSRGFSEFVDFGVSLGGGGNSTPPPPPPPPVSHIYSGTADGRVSESYWGGQNSLTTAQKANVSSPVTAISSQIYEGVMHIYTGTQSGEVYETYEGNGNTLTTQELANLGTPIDSIASVITSDGVLHVYTGTDAGTINETYAGNGFPITTVQKANVGSPVKGLSEFFTSGGVTHVFSSTASGDVYETYWGGNNSLTTAEKVNLGSSTNSLDAHITSDGVIHLFAGTTAGNIYEIYYGGNNNLPVTAANKATFASPVDKVAGLITGGVVHIYTGTSDGSLYETYWGDGNSLTTAQKANLGAAVTGLTAIITSDGVTHLFSSSQTGQLYETYWGGSNSLTTAEKADMGAAVNASTGLIQ